MTTTARVAAATAASVAYTFNIPMGDSQTFSAFDLSIGEQIVFECISSTGQYQSITYLSEGNKYTARLTKDITQIKLNGPVDARINKPVTKQSVEVVEYT